MNISLEEQPQGRERHQVTQQVDRYISHLKLRNRLKWSYAQIVFSAFQWSCIRRINTGATLFSAITKYHAGYIIDHAKFNTSPYGSARTRPRNPSLQQVYSPPREGHRLPVLAYPPCHHLTFCIPASHDGMQTMVLHNR